MVASDPRVWQGLPTGGTAGQSKLGASVCLEFASTSTMPDLVYGMGCSTARQTRWSLYRGLPVLQPLCLTRDDGQS